MEIKVGDIVSIDNGNDLRIIIGVVESTVYLKPLQYDVWWTHKFPIDRVTSASNEQIVEWLSYHVKDAYLANLRDIV